MSNTRGRSTDDPDDGGERFDDLPDGSGCFEIWEHLSEVRGRPASD